MSVAKNVEKTINEIKRTLLNDVVIRKLLYNNTPSAMSDSTPAKELVDPLISVNPLINYSTENEQTNIENFIVIYCSNVLLREEQYEVTISVDAFIRQDHYSLNDSATRLISLTDRIIDLMDGTKFSLAGKAYLEDFTLKTISSERLVGYSIGWNLIDGKVT